MYQRYNQNSNNEESNESDKDDICKDQKSYNKAFKNALNTYKLSENECKTDICKVKNTIFSIIVLVFYLWALLLASKVKDKEHRIMHFVFAILTGPIYVLSYYVSNFTLDTGTEK
jgi:uncharacterized membrane protein